MNAPAKEVSSAAAVELSGPACGEALETEMSSFEYRDALVLVLWRLRGDGVGAFGEEAAWSLNSFCAAAKRFVAPSLSAAKRRDP